MKSKVSSRKNREHQLKWIAENPEKHKDQNIRKFEKYYCSLKGRTTYMLGNARQRARKGNLIFELDSEWLREKLEKGICEVTGIPFDIQINGGKGHNTNSFSPSLERRNNSKGYTKENTEVVCWIYNRAKGAFPIEDLLTMLKALETRLNVDNEP